MIGSTGITDNETKLNQVCQYAYENGLYFVTYTHINDKWPQPQWVDYAKKRWGSHFLGLYAFDEAGGRQLDRAEYRVVKENTYNYTDSANKFVSYMNEYLKHYRDYYIHAGELPLFTADYGLYWFDYEAGYDVVLCEFGWNHSRLLNIALTRGAAKMQNKEWGTISTWTYQDPPYIESADDLYYDMILAYISGAKYLVVFSHPMEDSWDQTLTEEHLDSMKRLWNHVHTNPERLGIYCPTCNQIAYVLPKDYGWGFRGSEDKVWGIWVDELSTKLGKDLNYLVHTHHLSLDIIYDDPKYYNKFGQYSKLIFWNGTIITNNN